MSKEMIVFTKAKDLIDYTFCMTDSAKRYPKKVRFTFVDRMQNLVLDIYTNLIKINEVPINQRKPLQIEVLSDLKTLLFLIELSLKREYINFKQCELWTKKAMDVFYLTAAWMKKTK